MDFLAILNLVRAHWKLAGLALLALALAVQTVRLSHRGNQLERAKINLNECRQGRIDDRKAYEDAQRKARELNEAEVARIEAEQEKVTNNVEADLNARLERLRSELRAKAAKGAAGRPQAGADGPSAAKPDGEARVCLAPEQLLRAAENEERHDQLITWVEQQLKIAR